MIYVTNNGPAQNLPLNGHADISSRVRGIIIGLNLHPYLMNVSSQGSDVCAHMCRHA